MEVPDHAQCENCRWADYDDVMSAPGAPRAYVCGLLPPVVVPSADGWYNSVRPSVDAESVCSKWEDVA